MFTISEFSRISGLSIKALRLYHENGLLVPSIVDRENGYRYYDFNNVERARTISLLREMMFSLEEIKRILTDSSDDADAVSFLEKHRDQLEAKIAQMKKVSSSIDKIIRNEKTAKDLFAKNMLSIEEKEIPSIQLAGIRIKGKYSDCGQAFSKLGRTMGRYISGKPLNLFYDSEYKEDDADFESCFPIRGGKPTDGISIRELPGGRAIFLVHKGPYNSLGRSYSKLFSFVNERGYKTVGPTREVYIKGPGMIFKGNPTNYLTEIQFIIGSQ
jgi:DNA-binding transcriptional MerR regulator/effector-binding domain-containing protein